MANKVTKCQALGVKMAAPAAIMVATAKAVSPSGAEGDLKSLVAQLRAELDAERRTSRQQRREHEAEVSKIRNEEQTKASIALKDLAKKHLEERQKELELQRESLRARFESDTCKVVKLKDREITKLRGDLARCQDELKEELSKRGCSSAARATFDSERQKSLQEVRDLQIAKRLLEERLERAAEMEKRLQLEVRRAQESCKHEIARVEREANLEVKKLLEELKNKDHMLEMMDRAIHPDRSTLLKNRLDRLTIEDMLNLGRELDRGRFGVDYNNKARCYSISTNSNACSRKSENGESSRKTDCKNVNISDTESCQCVIDDNNSTCHNDNESHNQQCNVSIDQISNEFKSCSCECKNTNVKTVRKPNISAVVKRRSVSVGSGTSRDISKVRSRSTSSTGRNKEAAIKNAKNGGKINSKNRDTSKTRLNGSKCNDKKTSNIQQNVSITSEGEIEVSKQATDPSSTSNQSLDQCLFNANCALQKANLQKALDEREKRVRMNEGLYKAVVEKNNKLTADYKTLENKNKILNQQLHNLKNERDSSKKEIRRLNDIIKKNEVSDLDIEANSRSELNSSIQRCAELEQVLTSLRKDCQEKDRRIGLLIKSQQKYRHKYEPKTVRFLLPDDHVDEMMSLSHEDLKSSCSSSCSDPIECDELLIQSVHKDYENLMAEHMKLEKYCASLQQNWASNSSNENEELHAKRESLSVAIQALEEKLRLSEQREQSLMREAEELREQNEELEFRVLEIQELSDRNIPYTDADARLRRLEDEISTLHCRLAQYETIDINQLELDAISRIQPTNIPDPQRLSVENLRKLRESLSDSDEDNPMVQSFSTMTSGFDEISCISLELDDRTEMLDMPQDEIADLERDADDIPSEMPSEEADLCEEQAMQGCDDDMTESKVGKEISAVCDQDVEVLDGASINGSSRKVLSPLLISVNDLVNSTSDESQVENLNSNSEERQLFSVKQPVSQMEGLLMMHSATIPVELNHITANIPSQLESSHIESAAANEWQAGQTASEENERGKRIKDLQDQVDILERFDAKYSATILSLTEIETRLNLILPSQNIEPNHPATAMVQDNKTMDMKSCDEALQAQPDGTFWLDARQEMAANIAAIEQEIHALSTMDNETLSCDAEIESYTILSHCAHALENTTKILREEDTKSQDLEHRISELERQDSTEDNYSSLEERFNSCEDLPEVCSAHTELDEEDAVDAGILGSLKRLALDVVAAGFRTDILELKSLTQDFFATTVDDELNDIAFIDDDESACLQEDVSNGEEIETLPNRLRERNELRLNTKLSSLHQRFDFLSPTSFDNPDWTNSSHLETVNHCLLQQVEDLEKERDSLKDIVCRDDGVINEMTQHISLLENSEQELKRIVCKLEAAEEQVSEHACRLESQCKELQIKLNRAESIEATLRSELESRGKSEEEMEFKLRKSVDSLEQTAAKLRANLSEVELEKCQAERQSEELTTVIVSLQNRETAMMQRIKSLENLYEGLTEKTSDLEASLTSAYDEVTALTRQKDSLTQRLNSINDDCAELRKENEELSVERKGFQAEVEKLGESENFLKEANRKLWLSLQANIEEREIILARKCQRCSTGDQTRDNTANKGLNKELKEASVQVEQTFNKPDSLVQKPHFIHDQFLTHLANSYPNCLLFSVSLIAQLITSRSAQHGESSSRSSVTERKTLVEEMLKFIHTVKRESEGRGADTDKQTENITVDRSCIGDVSDMAEVEGEGEWWRIVERYDDINDVRAADTWNLWRQLEIDIMNLNLEDLRAILKEREADKSCQTLETVDKVAASREYLVSKKSASPPLPTTKPPADDSDDDINKDNCAEHGTQTDTTASSSETHSDTKEELNTLRHLLNQNERALSAQKNAVDRLTVEMRSWQQRALYADNEISRLAAELSTAQCMDTSRGSFYSEHKPSSSITENKHVTTDQQRSKIEPQFSQNPVSVRRVIDFYSSMGEGPVSPGSSRSLPSKSSHIPKLSPRGFKQLTTEAAVARLEQQLAATQEPTSNGSSISDNLEQPSQIPRLAPDWIQQQQQIRQQTGGNGSGLDDSDRQSAGSRILQHLPVISSAEADAAAAVEIEVPGPLPQKTSHEDF